MRSARFGLRQGASSLLFFSLTACGAAMAPREPMQPPREPATIEEATAQIRAAERALLGPSPDQPHGSGGATAGAPAPPVAPNAPSVSPVKPEASPAPPRPETDQKNGDGAERAKAVPLADDQAPPSPCERACRALQSMQSAVVALCRMTGEVDARCVQARATLEKSRESASLRSCGCAP